MLVVVEVFVASASAVSFASAEVSTAAVVALVFALEHPTIAESYVQNV